jgi:hypothetical protein
MGMVNILFSQVRRSGAGCLFLWGKLPLSKLLTCMLPINDETSELTGSPPTYTEKDINAMCKASLHADTWDTMPTLP